MIWFLEKIKEMNWLTFKLNIKLIFDFKNSAGETSCAGQDNIGPKL